MPLFQSSPELNAYIGTGHLGRDLSRRTLIAADKHPCWSMSLIGDYVLNRDASGARDEKHLRGADTPAATRQRRLD